MCNDLAEAMKALDGKKMQASVQPRPTEDLNTADTSCPSRTSAEHFDDKPGPCPKN